MSENPIKVLLVDDSADDALLARKMLENQGDFLIDHCWTFSEAFAYLASKNPDVILLDLGLPDSLGGLQTLEQVLEQTSQIPIVVLTGLANEDLGISAVQKGAQDYLVKDQVNSHSIVRSLRYAIERHRLAMDLQKALLQVKILSGLLPICSSCKKIRDAKGHWRQIETYIKEHSEAEFSHGICPDCAKELYAEYQRGDK